MSERQSSQPTAITLEQLIALNDEMAALVRAGVPLEEGLDRLGSDLPGRTGKVATRLAERMRNGESLPAILQSEPQWFPPVYRAVVEAGLRAGNLAGALQAVAGAARRLAQSRRLVVASLLYPLMVFVIAWGFFVFFVVKLAPAMEQAFEDVWQPSARVLAFFSGWRESAAYWGPAVPLLVLVWAGLWWYRSGRASLVQAPTAWRLIGWLPWMGQVVRSLRISVFTELLALLVESQVPLPQAIRLAAEATGDPQMSRGAAQVAAALERGDTLGDQRVENRVLPPLLSWMLVIGQQRSALLPALRHAAEIYRQRAARQADTARIFLPVLLTAVIGGGALLCYALVVFVPWISLLHALT